MSSFLLKSVRTHHFADQVPLKEPRSRVYTESAIQRDFVAWLRDRPDWMVMRLENAAKRTPSQAIRDKAMGMETGAPDLVLLYKQDIYFFEIKSKQGRVSDMQEHVHEQLRLRGHKVRVVWGVEDAIAQAEEIERGAMS